MSKTPPHYLSARRALGKIFQVSALGLGTLPLAGAYGPCDRETALAVLKAALDAGIDFIDTSDLYGFGQVETWTGEAIRGRRPDVVISTKCGFDFKDRDDVKLNGRPDHIFKAADASLGRSFASLVCGGGMERACAATARHRATEKSSGKGAAFTNGGTKKVSEQTNPKYLILPSRAYMFR